MSEAFWPGRNCAPEKAQPVNCLVSSWTKIDTMPSARPTSPLLLLCHADRLTLPTGTPPPAASEAACGRSLRTDACVKVTKVGERELAPFVVNLPTTKTSKSPRRQPPLHDRSSHHSTRWPSILSPAVQAAIARVAWPPVGCGSAKQSALGRVSRSLVQGWTQVMQAERPQVHRLEAVLRLPLAQSFSCWRLLLWGQSANTKCCITSHGSGSDFLRHHGHDNINNGVLLPKPVDHEIPVVRAPCEITAALFLPILRTFRRRPAKPRRSKPRQPAHLRLGLWGNSRRPAGRRPRRAFPLLHLLRNPSGLSSSIP